jgi:hypothetical protein
MMKKLMSFLHSYYQKYGGRMGVNAVKFWDWQFRGDVKAKALFCNPSADSELGKIGFTFQTKNGICG